MGEFDEGTVSQPNGEGFEAPAVDPVAAAPAPADDVPAALTIPPVTPPEGDESGAELIARLAAELAAESADAPELESPPSAALEPESDAAAVAAEPVGEVDDIEAAIAAANEQIGVASTLDDIAPGTTQAEETEPESVELATRFGAPWWPFLIYLVLWIAFAGLGVWELKQLPVGQVAYESQPYMLFLIGGIIMAAVGPILILAVWLGAWLSQRRQRAGLLTSSLIKGAIVTVIGVALWWGSFIAVDFLRLGRTF